MDVYNRIGEGLNQADLAVAKATGQIVGFTHRDELPVPLYVSPISIDQDNAFNPIGNREGDESLSVIMPSQPVAWSGSSGFSGTWNPQPQWSGAANQPQEGDVMRLPYGDTENIYVVSGQVQKFNNGYSYIVPFVRRRSTTLGEWS